MTELASSALINHSQIIHSYQHLAAIGAGLLFLVEGILLTVFVFSNGRITQKHASPSLNP